MPKSFKKFRDGQDDDEWGSTDDDTRQKDHRMKYRRELRKQKVDEKFSKFDKAADDE